MVEVCRPDTKLRSCMECTWSHIRTFRLDMKGSIDYTGRGFCYNRAGRVTVRAEEGQCERPRSGSEAVKCAPSFQFIQVSKDDTYVHLQCLQQVASDILPHQLLSLRPGQHDVPLLQESRNVSLCDLCLRVHPVLQLAQPLGRKPQLCLCRC